MSGVFAFVGCTIPQLNAYSRASVLVENALHGRPPAPLTPASIWARRVYHHVVYRNLYTAIALMDLLLAIWEPPARVTDPPLLLLRMLDLFALLFFSADTAVQYFYFGRRDFWHKKWTVAKVVILPLMFLNLFLSLPRGGLGVEGYFGALRALRPIFLLERLRNVRKVVTNIMKMVPKVVNVAILLGFANLFFGVTGFLLFSERYAFGDEKCRTHDLPKRVQLCSVFTKSDIYTGEECYNYFSSLSESMYHLFTLQTTANFPDVMLPVFRCDESASLFFVLYLVAALFFLLNLTLAVAADEFKRLTEKKVVVRYENMFLGFDQAFKELWKAEHEDGGGPRRGGLQIRDIFLQRSTWVQFMHAHRPQLGSEFAGKLYDAVVRGRRGLYRYDFRRMALFFGHINAISSPSSTTHPSTSQPTPSHTTTKPTSSSTTTPSPSPSPSPVSNPLLTTTGPSTTPPPSSPTAVHRSRGSGEEAGVEMRDSDGESGSDGDGGGMRRVASRGSLNSVPDWPGAGDGSGSAEERCCLDRGRMREVLSQRWLAIVFDSAVILNAVMVLVQLGQGNSVGTAGAAARCTEEIGGPGDCATDVIQYLTLAIFVCELLLKIYAWGIVDFLRRSSFNKLDVILLLLSVVALSLQLADFRHRFLSTGLVFFFRVLRTLRLLRVLPDFALTVTSFLDVVPVLGNYLTVLLCVFYAFSIIGMESFAGMLPRPPAGVRPDDCFNNNETSLAYRVCRSPYGREDYYPLNFDHLSTTLTICFHQLVVNNWPIIGEGLTAAFETEWVRWYFVFFHLIAVVVVLNVLIAFLIESFSIQRSRREAARERFLRLKASTAGSMTLSSALERALSRRPDDDQSQAGDMEMPESLSDVLGLFQAWLVEDVDAPGKTAETSDWIFSIEQMEREAALELSAGADFGRHGDEEQGSGSRRDTGAHSFVERDPDSPMDYLRGDSSFMQEANRIGEQLRDGERDGGDDVGDGGGDGGVLSGTGGVVGSSSADIVPRSHMHDSIRPPSQGQGGGFVELPDAGEEWRTILATSGVDFSAWRIWREPRPQDIYDTLYRETIRKKFPKTFHGAAIAGRPRPPVARSASAPLTHRSTHASSAPDESGLHSMMGPRRMSKGKQ